MKDIRIISQGDEARGFATQPGGVFYRPLKPKKPLPEGPGFELRKDAVYGTWVMGPKMAPDMPFFQAAHSWVKDALGPNPFGPPGTVLWVAESWMQGRKLLVDVPEVLYRADLLDCGHSREDCVYVRYRCNLAPHCSDTHAVVRCRTCFDAGEGRPPNWGYEVNRRKSRTGPWRAGTYDTARSRLEVVSVRAEWHEGAWRWAVEWQRATRGAHVQAA